MVRAGDMRHLVRLEARSTVQDSVGEQLDSWTLVCERRAAIQRTPGTETFGAQARQGRVPTVFRLRYPVDVSPPVGPEMRLIHDGRVYDVVGAVDQAGRKEELVIIAEERLGETP